MTAGNDFRRSRGTTINLTASGNGEGAALRADGPIIEPASSRSAAECTFLRKG